VGHGGMDGMVVWMYAPYRNQTQTTPHQGGQYCKKSYVGGDHIYKKRETGWLPPSPPHACFTPVMQSQIVCVVIVSDNPCPMNSGIPVFGVCLQYI